MAPILISKLPGALNLNLSRTFDSNSDVWKFDDIMTELRKELEARERCEPESEKVERQRPEKPTAEALHVEQYIQSCAYCDGRHYADQCKTITYLVKRKDMLKRKRRCFLCTKPNHVIKDCKSKRNCFKCNGRHHTSICGGNVYREREDEKKDATDTRMNTAAVTSRNTILLQTAQLQVHSIFEGWQKT